MRVGILTQYYPPEIGAPQARLSQLAEALVRREHEVVVLTAMPNYPAGRVFPGYGGFVRTETRDGVRVVRTWLRPSQSPAFRARMTAYLTFGAAAAAVGLVKLPRLDVLISESPPLTIGVPGFVLSRAKRAKWVFNVSDLWPDSAVRLGALSGRPLRVAQKLEAWCYRRSWRVSGQSREIVADVERRFPTVTTMLLSNGVDGTRFGPERRDAARRQGVGDDEVLAVYAGLHGVAQGLDQVVQAAAGLPADGDVRIVLVGDGPEKRGLVELAASLDAPAVQFVDPIPYEEVPGLLASADVAIIPLREYLPGAVPSKLYEAMASAIPVVLVASGEAAQIVESADAGIVVAPGDVDGLRDALVALAADPERRARLGANGRRVVLERFDRRAICDAFIDELEAGIGGAR